MKTAYIGKQHIYYKTRNKSTCCYQMLDKARQNRVRKVNRSNLETAFGFVTQNCLWPTSRNMIHKTTTN